jgi:hypothetical protein
VFIEIYFEQAEDYNNTNGLLVPNGDIQFMNYPKELKSKIKGMVYMLSKVTSTFSKGKFEQSLSGLIPEFAQAGNKVTTPPVAPNSRTGTTGTVKAINPETGEEYDKMTSIETEKAINTETGEEYNKLKQVTGTTTSNSGDDDRGG